MTLASPLYMAFLAGMVIAIALVRSKGIRELLILAGSWGFFATWDWRFLPLLVGLTALAYGSAVAMSRAADERRRLILAATVVLQVSVLGVFKYTGFSTETIASIARTSGIDVPIIELALPIALSFITFQTIAYVVDVYRRELEPASLIEVGLLVAFFPHLLAGPLLRPSDFIEQLRHGFKVRRAELMPGVQQFVAGLAMKVLIADQLAVFVNPVMDRPGIYGASTLWLAMFAYSIQIYTDFAGYSSMAIGSARLMGIRIPANFFAPYASLNITEFWRRWHISLSLWLRCYLYIPLGGNRKGPRRQALNLMIVMLLAGLWHGAAWGFVVWGGLHGAALVLNKVWIDRSWPRRPESVSAWVSGTLAWAVTWLFVTLAWVFFRVPDVPDALGILGRMFGAAPAIGVRWMAPSAVVLVPVVLLVSVLYVRRPITLAPLNLISFKGAFVATTLAIALVLFWPSGASPFIYLQF